MTTKQVLMSESMICQIIYTFSLIFIIMKFHYKKYIFGVCYILM